MDCCGKKRSAWPEEAQDLLQEEKSDELKNTREQKPKVFEYTGKRSIKIKGAMTGNIYYFRFPGHRIEVPDEDAFAMMAEVDVKSSTRKKLSKK